MRRFSHIVTTLNHVQVNLAGISLLVIVAITVWEVLLRYFFNRPTVWSLEIAQYTLLFSVLLAASYTLEIDAHIKITALLERLSPKFQRLLEVITSVCGLFFCIVFTLKTWELFWLAVQKQPVSTGIGVPLVIPYFFLPWGGLFLCLQYIVTFQRSFTRLLKGGQ